MRLLAFFAHPDDETVFLGGTFAYLTSIGVEVHFVCATRGEGGEMGDPPICTRDELGGVRERELSCAVETLGGTSLEFLDFQDPLVGSGGELFPFSENIDELVNRLREQLKRIHPDVVISHGPGGEYGHPGHKQAHQGLMSALAEVPDLDPAVYSPSWLSRETGQFTPAPDIVVDIEPWIEVKIQAAYCHKSQHGLFLRHGESRAGRPVTIPEMIRTQEALCRIHPIDQKQADSLVDLMEKISIRNPDVISQQG
jgi:LmbE family N-acetylglucosaminyl deacetylase